MSNRPAAMGLDAELAAKRAAKYDPVAEGEAIAFIKEQTGIVVPAGSDNVHSALKDGSVLAELANSVKPGSFSNTKAQTMPFKQMEVINKFLEVASSLGVPITNSFQTVDLFENQNIGQVIICINALKLAAQGKGKLNSHASKEVVTDHSVIPMQTHGYTGGANASGQNFGLGRQIVNNK
ncbi:hypothetical protein CAOG_03772 [Capsaspora owczarzaki ATCC 30864]|uniref:Calponin-homology (CH) domain-containing protein n=1 Tax=Capsaspora owczarzaki (strain ATCC 30864) TaxID=595528 RepID=A0A0D2X2N8_CAPO3|nr:hypothetical protein CAOG_03772 [Capsaspora owczarzaki ATCC 30864]KJE92884.1 hypothetical protein CAOG_003772 [Capsaspora owczarzaki ATCC 30864]|eukprot:XP_004363500.1 hypothetical protein CAOG_03772 [Capsaspora owczarzaki ATCC 30864]